MYLATDHLSKGEKPIEILPPPYHILFWHILRGWSLTKKATMKQGALIAPKNQWLPDFIKLISSKNDCTHVLKNYALSGAKLDNHPRSMLDCIERAFEQKDISEKIISEFCERVR